MGDEVRVTVIAAGFDRWDDRETPSSRTSPTRRLDDADLLGSGPFPGGPGGPGGAGGPTAGGPPPRSASTGNGYDDLDSEDEFDVPSFLK
jgi:hypothetical protein